MNHQQSCNEEVRAKSGLTIEIKKYRATAQWKWDLRDNKQKEKRLAAAGKIEDNNFVQEEDDDEEAICGICRQPFDSTCSECLIPGDDCPPVLGTCSHAFHMHCIVKWLEPQGQHQDERRQQCPMCRAEWHFQGE